MIHMLCYIDYMYNLWSIQLNLSDMCKSHMKQLLLTVFVPIEHHKLLHNRLNRSYIRTSRFLLNFLVFQALYKAVLPFLMNKSYTNLFLELQLLL